VKEKTPQAVCSHYRHNFKYTLHKACALSCLCSHCWDL
jgi:hypothetical protein